MEWSNEMQKIRYMVVPSIEAATKALGAAPSLAVLNAVYPDGSFIYRTSIHKRFRGIISEELIIKAINRAYVVADRNYRLYVLDSRVYEPVMQMRMLTNKNKANYQGV